MDHARKIGKHSEPSTIRTPSRIRSSSKPCTNATPEAPAKEDHRLANWSRWLADRRRRQQHLSDVLGREPGDLLLNAHEKVRRRNESRCLLQSAVRPEVTNQDKHRGNPAFWRSVDRLVKRVEDDDVVAHLDREARNLPPELVRVALPDFIRKEKMLIEPFVDAAKVNLASKWESGDYLRQRTSELTKELQLLEGKRPETEELIIIGKKLQCDDGELNFIRVPVITITPPDTRKKLLHEPDDRIALTIQEREFVLEKGRHFERLSLESSRKLQETQEDQNDKVYAYSLFEFDRVYKIIPKRAEPITWSLTFQCANDEMCTRHIVLENRGVYVVKLHWRKEPDLCVPFRLPDRLVSPFFFDKNHQTILPGQKIELPLWFRSEQPTISTESWELVFEPRIYPGKLYLRLWGMSEGQRMKDQQGTKCDDIRAHLRIRLRNTTVKQVIDEIVCKATSEHHLDNVPYQCFFLESDVFQARNPTRFYRSDLVNELKAMFEAVTGCNAERWNLSMADLYLILVKTKDPRARREQVRRFQEIGIKCLQPTRLYTRTYWSKEQLARWLLSGFFNRFEDESDYVANSFYSERLSDDEDEESTGDFGADNHSIYREVFYVRIYILLADTVDRICAAIDSRDFLNKEGVH